MYKSKTREEQLALLSQLNAAYDQAKAQGLKLDMSRGKPAPDQLDLSMDLLDVLGSDSNVQAEDGSDCRNYGVPDGIPEAKRLMAELMDVNADEVFIGSGSSLSLMHTALMYCWLFPLPGCDKPWGKQETVKFLCLVPGYDRHFNASAHLGIQNIPVPMTDDGPDMDAVEKLVAADPSIKGMWCVPKFSNPTGVTYSDKTVRRLAAMKTAAPDFRIFWDNAYAIHDLVDEGQDQLLPLLPALKEAGSPNRAFLFASFAKVTFGGGGIAAMGASTANIAYFKGHMAKALINSDKINQLRHARYFRNLDGLKAHMAKHRRLLAPKFRMVTETLERELGGLEIARWTNPKGGYFISLDTLPGCARRTVALCKEAGVVMTPAGATFPYGNDPEDRNIRIAPSFPTVAELQQAAELLCLCVKIASLEELTR